VTILVVDMAQDGTADCDTLPSEVNVLGFPWATNPTWESYGSPS